MQFYMIMNAINKSIAARTSSCFSNTSEKKSIYLKQSYKNDIKYGSYLH